MPPARLADFGTVVVDLASGGLKVTRLNLEQLPDGRRHEVRALTNDKFHQLAEGGIARERGQPVSGVVDGPGHHLGDLLRISRILARAHGQGHV